MYYADNLHNLPPAFVKLLSSFPTVHNVSIFLTIRQARGMNLLNETFLLRQRPNMAEEVPMALRPADLSGVWPGNHVFQRDVVQVPVPTVGKHERTLVREMPFAGFYRVVTRYGYMDEVR